MGRVSGVSIKRVFVVFVYGVRGEDVSCGCCWFLYYDGVNFWWNEEG